MDSAHDHGKRFMIFMAFMYIYRSTSGFLFFLHEGAIRIEAIMQTPTA